MRLVYLSPLPFDSFSQRPHELVKYFHERTGGKVLWVDPYPTRFPNLSDFFRQGVSTANRDQRSPDWITVVKPAALPIEPLPFSNWCNALLWQDAIAEIKRFSVGDAILGIGKPSLFALHLLREQSFQFSFYDAMDDFPAFYSGISRMMMSRRERELMQSVSIVLTSSTHLYTRLKHFSANVRLALNACAPEKLPSFADRTDKQAPIVGYVGTLAKWFDWDIIEKLALRNPSFKFRLIGPVYTKPQRMLPSNILLEGPLPHAQALRVMSEFDIGLIPFKRTTLTGSVDPIKFYEYRAMGLPIVTTRFGEMTRREGLEGIFLINEESDLAKTLEQALSWRPSGNFVEDFRKENSWSKRFDDLRLFN